MLGAVDWSPEVLSVDIRKRNSVRIKKLVAHSKGLDGSLEDLRWGYEPSVIGLNNIKTLLGPLVFLS